MSSQKKTSILRESGRWLRVGSLSLSVLGPFLSFLINRLRAQAEADEALLRLHEDQKAATTDTRALQEDLQHRLQSLRGNLTETLTALRSRPYNRELLRRGEVLTDELREQANKLSHIISNQGGKISHDLLERGGGLSHSLLEHGTDFSQELLKRTRRAQIEKMQQKRNFWVAFGFGLGLTAAGIITYVLIQRRQREQLLAENESVIQLAQEDKSPLNGATVPPVQKGGETYTVQRAGNTTTAASTGETSTPSAPIKPPVITGIEANEPAQLSSNVPADAAFIGVTSTKRYYPVNTPLERITDGVGTDAAPIDVIYFTSEREARLQGFSAAEA